MAMRTSRLMLLLALLPLLLPLALLPLLPLPLLSCLVVLLLPLLLLPPLLLLGPGVTLLPLLLMSWPAALPENPDLQRCSLSKRSFALFICTSMT